MKRWHIPAVMLTIVGFCSSGLRGQTQLATVPVGANSTAIAFNAATIRFTWWEDWEIA